MAALAQSTTAATRGKALIGGDAFQQGIPFVQVDAFTRVPFAGNPAAVVYLDSDSDGDGYGVVDDDAWMANVAREMNLTETAFATPRAEAGQYDLRWFTAGGTEVDLCGHATLAAFHAMAQANIASQDVTFHTRSGPLTARMAVDSPVAYELDFPLEVAQECGRDNLALLSEALGTDIKWLGINRVKYYLAELSSESAVRALRPDFNKLKLIPDHVGVIATALADGDANGNVHDYVSRFFAPNVGIDEDPVTGSAHCTSGPYWARKLQKDTLLAYQCSSRGGEVRVRVEWERQRAVLQGDAVTTLKGVIIPSPPQKKG